MPLLSDLAISIADYELNEDLARLELLGNPDITLSGLLEINEAVVDYRYHCQGPEAQLVFRYDSTPHFPDLPGFPHRKHVPSITLPAPPPPLEEVIAEAASSFPD